MLESSKMNLPKWWSKMKGRLPSLGSLCGSSFLKRGCSRHILALRWISKNKNWVYNQGLFQATVILLTAVYSNQNRLSNSTYFKSWLNPWIFLKDFSVAFDFSCQIVFEVTCNKAINWHIFRLNTKKSVMTTISKLIHNTQVYLTHSRDFHPAPGYLSSEREFLKINDVFKNKYDILMISPIYSDSKPDNHDIIGKCSVKLVNVVWEDKCSVRG